MGRLMMYDTDIVADIGDCGYFLYITYIVIWQSGKEAKLRSG